MPDLHLVPTKMAEYRASVIDEALDSARDPIALLNLLIEQMKMSMVLAEHARTLVYYASADRETLSLLNGYLMDMQGLIDYDLRTSIGCLEASL